MENIRNLLIAALACGIILLIVVILGVNIRQSGQLKKAADTEGLRAQISQTVLSELTKELPELDEETLKLLSETVNVSLEERLGQTGDALTEEEIETLTLHMRDELSQRLLAEGVELSDEERARLLSSLSGSVNALYTDWNAKLQITAETLNKAETVLTDVQDRVSALSDAQTSLTEELRGKLSGYTPLTEHHNLKADVESMEKHFSERLSEASAGLNADVSALKARVSAAEETLSAHDTLLADHEARISVLEAGHLAQQEEIDRCFQSVSSGKALLASALTDKNTLTDAEDTFAVIAANIGKCWDDGYAAGYAEGLSQAQPKDVTVEEIRHYHTTESDCYQAITGTSRIAFRVASVRGDSAGDCPHCGKNLSARLHGDVYWKNPDGTETYIGDILCQCSYCGYLALRNDSCYAPDATRSYTYYDYACGFKDGEIIGYTILKN